MLRAGLVSGRKGFARFFTLLLHLAHVLVRLDSFALGRLGGGKGGVGSVMRLILLLAAWPLWGSRPDMPLSRRGDMIPDSLCLSGLILAFRPLFSLLPSSHGWLDFGAGFAALHNTLVHL